ncbi:MAG: RDD family protein, partial [Flavobacteriaceae bacterium]|nr:RDD family protein [Flavobacteriaceae bacterium]
MRNLAINTAQNVNVDYKLVGLGERMVAFLIDAMILFAYISVVENLFAISEIFNADSWTRIGFLSLFMLPAFCYSLLCHLLFNGRTVGKMILNIKVVRLDGAPTEWYNLIVRWLLR